MSNLYKEADAEIKASLEAKIKEVYKRAILVKAKNTKEIDRLTARNTKIDENLADIAKRCEAGEFLEIADIDYAVNEQTEAMEVNTSTKKLRI